jgi:hypothetical protein
MDHATNYIIMLIQQKRPDSETDMVLSTLKLFDITENKAFFDVELTIDSLIGRLKSGLCRINNGHIYFNNNLIKMRLDLINSPKSHKYKDQELFDFYYGMFNLDKDTIVRSGTPIDSFRYHRFVFITRDESFKRP